MEMQPKDKKRFFASARFAQEAETLYTALALAVYVLVFLALARFKLSFLFNWRMLLAVLAGTLVLSAAGYRRGISRMALRRRAAYNAMIAGYLAAFLFFFAALSKTKAFDPYALAMSLRPIFYGFLLNVLLKADTEKEESPAPPDAETLRIALCAQGLSARECDVAALLYQGFTNAEIAQKLFISESTVKKHATACYAALSVKGREQFKCKMQEYLSR